MHVMTLNTSSGTATQARRFPTCFCYLLRLTDVLAAVPVPQRLLRHQWQPPPCCSHGCSPAKQTAGFMRQRCRYPFPRTQPLCPHRVSRPLCRLARLHRRLLHLLHLRPVLSRHRRKSIIALNPYRFNTRRVQRHGRSRVLGPRSLRLGCRQHPSSLPFQHRAGIKFFAFFPPPRYLRRRCYVGCEQHHLHTGLSQGRQQQRRHRRSPSLRRVLGLSVRLQPPLCSVASRCCSAWRPPAALRSRQ